MKNNWYKCNEFIVRATPMSKWEFVKNYPKQKHNMITDSIDIEGMLCDWNGYKFWAEKDWFNNHYTKYDKQNN